MNRKDITLDVISDNGYTILNDGSVWSKPRMHFGPGSHDGKILAQRVTKYGMREQRLFIDGYQYSFSAGRLVAAKYLGICLHDNNIIIVHKDGNRGNNSVENIEVIYKKSHTKKNQTNKNNSKGKKPIADNIFELKLRNKK